MKTPIAITASQEANDRLDAALLRAVAQGDTHALELLYDRYVAPLAAHLNRIVKDSSATEAILQEVFLQIWRKAGEFDNRGAWCFRIARNRGLDRLRRVKVRPVATEKEIESYYTLTDTVLDGALTASEVTAQQNQYRQHLNLALAELPPEQRYCVELSFFEGMSQRDIALVTKTPIGTVKTRIKMAMQKMQRYLRMIGYNNATGSV